VIAPLAVAGSSILALPKYIARWPRAKCAGTERAWWRTVALSMLNNLAAGCRASLLGIVARRLWL
jgi:hypothetical protein